MEQGEKGIATNKMGVPLIAIGGKFDGDPVQALAFRRTVWQKEAPLISPDSEYAKRWAENRAIRDLAAEAKIPPTDLVAIAETNDVPFDPQDPLFVPAFKAWGVIHAGAKRMWLSDLARMGVPDDVIDDLEKFLKDQENK